MKTSSWLVKLLMMFTVGWLFLVGLPSFVGSAEKDDLAEIVDKLRDATKLAPIEPEKQTEFLAKIGIAQVQLRDLKGALKSFQAIPEGDSYKSADFIAQLASL